MYTVYICSVMLSPDIHKKDPFLNGEILTFSCEYSYFIMRENTYQFSALCNDNISVLCKLNNTVVTI